MWPFKRKEKAMPVVGECYAFYGDTGNPFKEDELIGAKLLQVSPCGGYVRYRFIRSGSGLDKRGGDSSDEMGFFLNCFAVNKGPCAKLTDMIKDEK